MVKFKSIYKTDGLGQARYDKQYGDGEGGEFWDLVKYQLNKCSDN